MDIGERKGDAAGAADEFEAGPEEELERLQVGEFATQEEAGIDRGRGGIETEERHRPLNTRRDEAQPGRSDHPEGAFASTEKPAEVVAGVVLRQPSQVRDDGSRPEHRLDPQQLRSRGAVAQHLESACIRCNGAADRCAVTATQIDTVGPPGCTCGGLDLGH